MIVDGFFVIASMAEGFVEKLRNLRSQGILLGDEVRQTDGDYIRAVRKQRYSPIVVPKIPKKKKNKKKKGKSAPEPERSVPPELLQGMLYFPLLQMVERPSECVGVSDERCCSYGAQQRCE